MAGGSVSFTLDDGETLGVADEDLRRVYDVLWDLAKEPGAVSTAVLLMDAGRLRPFARMPISLTGGTTPPCTNGSADAAVWPSFRSRSPNSRQTGRGLTAHKPE
jgi:hypothetical protein